MKSNRVIFIGSPRREVVREIGITEACGLTTIDIDLPLVPIVTDGYLFTGGVPDVDVQSPFIPANNRRMEFKAGIASGRNRYRSAWANRRRSIEQSFVPQCS